MNKLSDLTPEQRLDLGEKLREMPEDDKKEFIAGLTVEQQSELLYDPVINLRRKQYVDLTDTEKNITLITSGRGLVTGSL